MRVTREEIKTKLFQYLNRSITIQELVDWAENAVQEAEYEVKDFDTIRDILGRLGLADVKEFGLTWDDCYNFLNALGYRIKIAVV